MRPLTRRRRSVCLFFICLGESVGAAGSVWSTSFPGLISLGSAALQKRSQPRDLADAAAGRGAASDLIGQCQNGFHRLFNLHCNCQNHRLFLNEPELLPHVHPVIRVWLHTRSVMGGYQRFALGFASQAGCLVELVKTISNSAERYSDTDQVLNTVCSSHRWWNSIWCDVTGSCCRYVQSCSLTSGLSRSWKFNHQVALSKITDLQMVWLLYLSRLLRLTPRPGRFSDILMHKCWLWLMIFMSLNLWRDIFQTYPASSETHNEIPPRLFLGMSQKKALFVFWREFHFFSWRNIQMGDKTAFYDSFFILTRKNVLSFIS